MAIVMAAASTTRPASWPPIRRGFSGSVFAADVALILREPLWRPADAPAVPADGLSDGCGETVGNSWPGLVTPGAGAGTGGIAGTGGNVGVVAGGVVAGVVAGGVVGAGVWLETILNEPAALNETAPFAVAFAVSVT